MPDVLSQDDSPLSFMPGSPMLAPPPPAPPMAPQAIVAGGGAAAPAPPAAPNLQEQIAKATGQGDAAIADVRKSQAAEIAAMEAKAKAKQPYVDKALGALQQPLPQPPKLEKPPAAPKGRDQHADENWLFAASLLGSLAGAFTRNHATNALAAFSGAMEGYNEGNKQKIAENMKIWEAENKRVQETNQEAMTEYKAALENRKFSVDQMSTAIELAGMKYKDEAAIQAARTKNSLVMAQYFDTRARAAENMLKATGDMQQQKLDRLQAAAEQYVASAEGQARIAAIKRGEMPPPSQNQRGTSFIALRDQMISDQLAAQGYDFKSYDIDKGVKKQEALIPGRVEAAGKMAAERVGATRATNLEGAARSAGPLVSMAAEAAQHVPATAFPRLNSILQQTAEELGDPAMIRFKFANLELGRLIARVANPSSSTITNYQAQAAADLFLTSASPEGYQQALESAKSFIEREYKAAQEQKAHAPLAPIDLPDTTQRSLKPGPRQFLPNTQGNQQGNPLKPAWSSPLPQSIENMLPGFMSPRKPPAPPTPDMPIIQPKARPALPPGMPKELEQLYNQGYSITPQ